MGLEAEIDRVNILEATLLAMRRAALSLPLDHRLSFHGTEAWLFS
jgi:hypothetical protein